MKRLVLFLAVAMAVDLYMRKPEDVTIEEYASFYKSLSNDSEDHLYVKHFSSMLWVEGQLEFQGLLFVPRRALAEEYKSINVRLSAQSDLDIDDYEGLVPEWLSFVLGVVDVQGEPVSDEMLQEQIFRVINKQLVLQCIAMISEIADMKDVYRNFYEQFSKNIKHGVVHDATNRAKVAELLRYHTSFSGDKQIGLGEYVDRMIGDQKDVYYITGESIEAISSSPLMDAPREAGLEVLYIVGPDDEYVVQQLKEFDGKKLQKIDKDDFDVDEGLHPGDGGGDRLAQEIA